MKMADEYENQVCSIRSIAYVFFFYIGIQMVIKITIPRMIKMLQSKMSMKLCKRN